MTSKFKLELLPHQKEWVTFARINKYNVCGLEMGLGKTASSLYLAHITNSKVLIICPAYLKRNWGEEVEKFTEGLDVTIESYTSVKKLDVSNWDLIIADEAHYLKNKDAQRTKYFHTLVKEVNPKYLTLLSGTPIKNRVSEFWSLLQLCYYGGNYPEFHPFYRLYMKFCNRYSHERTFEVNGIPIVRFDGVKNTEELKKLISPIYFRRKAIDVLDLPKVTHSNIMPKSSKKFDVELEKAYELFKVNPKDPQYMSLKASNALAKVNDTIKFVKDCLEQDKKVVVFTCHTLAVKEIALKLKVSYIDGSVPSDKRHEIISQFNSKAKGVLVATIGSASTGFNLTSANYMVFNDFPFVPADLEQARKRIHRIGQHKTCFYYYMMSSEFDVKLFDMIQRKTKDIEKVYK